MAFTCPTCGQTFLQKAAYKHHTEEHLQTHINMWQAQGDQTDISEMPVGLNRELFKVFEKYSVDKAIICLWKNGQLNSATRPVGRERELVEILKDWLAEPE
jgi:hemerythrin